ncbi:MAG: DUF4286 family protein [Bacteroidia bacterium]|nr:DUF4286 family protein [Bacteroidia bacterium]
MIIYNVTINIEEQSHSEWLEWLQQKHIPDVMATGFFNSFKLLKLLSTQDDESGFTYAIQYSCTDMDTYIRYQNESAPALQSDSLKMFGGKFVSFRTLLEEI